MQTITIFMLIGLSASLLMFAGDMLLYFTTGPYEVIKNGNMAPVVEIMKEVPAWRLRLGGIVGPVAAFLHCVGFYHLILLFSPEYRPMAVVTACLFGLGIVIGGAYHSQCSYLGMIGKTGSLAALEQVERNLQYMAMPVFALPAAGCVLLIFSIWAGHTAAPRELVLFNPGVVHNLRYLWRRLPQPLKIVLYGGWNSLVYAVYYLAALILLK